MTAEAKGSLARLSAMTAAAALAVLAFVLLMPEFRPLGEFVRPEPGASLLEEPALSGGDLEMVSLYDYSPLFLTTGFNYSRFDFPLPSLSIPEGAPASTPDDAMADFREKLLARAADGGGALSGYPDSYVYSDFMQADAAASLPEVADVSTASLSVLSSESGKTVFSEKFPVASVGGGRIWSPTEMTVVVGDDGSWSAPFSVTSTGLDALDRELEEYVGKNLRRMRLKRGYYTIIVTP